jgi:hypothetical protein
VAVLLVLASTPFWLPDLPWVRRWVAQQITLRTGLSCEIGHLRLLTPDGSTRAEHVRLFGTDASGARKEITLPMISARLDWHALRHRRISLAELIIDGGSLVWQVGGPAVGPEADSVPEPAFPSVASIEPDRPSPVGLVPLAEPGQSPEPQPTVAASAGNPPEAMPATETAAAEPAFDIAPSASPSPKPSSPTTASSTPRRPPPLGHLTIRNLELRALAREPHARELASARLEATVPLARRGAGRLELASVVLLGERRWIDPVAVPLSSDGAMLSTGLAPVDCPGGRAKVSVRCDITAQGLPVLAEMTSEPLDLSRLVAWAVPGVTPPQGTVQAEVKLRGYMRYPRSFQSVGWVEARQVVVPLAEWLRTAGLDRWRPFLSKPEVRADPGRLLFRSVGGQVAVDDASLMADEASVRATGTAALTTGLNLSVRTYLAAGGIEALDKLTRPWPPERTLEFTMLPNSPWVYLDSWVQGSFEDPRVALWGRSWTFSELRQELDRLNLKRESMVDG